MMITSHPAIHTCQNYAYFRRISGGLPVIIAVCRGFGHWIVREATCVRLSANPAAARGGMSPSDTNCDRRPTVPSEKPGSSRRRAAMPCQD
ncbi:MAG: hypothetical protein AAGI03_09510 [Pseudomonadota bacterium]